MEPDDQLQVKERTCLGGRPGPEPSSGVCSGSRPRTGTLEEARPGVREEHIILETSKSECLSGESTALSYLV